MYTVLVVENNPTILKLILHHLEMEGCEVLTAIDGLIALNILYKRIPDILFTDIIMPKVSGDQLCRIIRRNDQLKDLYIAVHSSTTLEDHQQILDIDADVYIAKGPKANLKNHVRHVLEQYKKGIRRAQEVIGADSLFPREITRELLLARKHYQAIFNNVAEAVVELDETGQIIQANKATQKLLEKDTLSLLSSNFADFITGPKKDDIANWINRVNEDESTRYSSSYENPLEVNNRKILLNMVSVNEQDKLFIIVILQDITHQKETEAKLAKTLLEFNAVIDTIDYGVLLMDSDLRARIVNQAFRDMWEIPEELSSSSPTMRELMEHTKHNYLFDSQEISFDEYIDRRTEAVLKGATGPTELRKKNGQVLLYQCVVLPDNGRMLTYFDITGLKRTEEKLAEALEKVSNLANHDPLTGLPNLRLASERLLRAISMAKRKSMKAAIMFIDLDGFKDVNDSHGHAIGNKLLRMVADRLVSSLRETDTVARIGGDEFLVIQTEVNHRFAAANVAEKIVGKIAEPFLLEGKEIIIGASIGISIFPEHGKDSRTLIKKADDAMYHTKRIGKNNYTFTPE